MSIASQSHITDELIKLKLNEALRSNNPDIVYWAIQHPLVNSYHINLALDYYDNLIKIEAINHLNVSPTNINKALKDENKYVTLLASLYKNFNEENVDFSLNVQDDYIRIMVIEKILKE